MINVLETGPGIKFSVNINYGDDNKTTQQAPSPSTSTNTQNHYRITQMRMKDRSYHYIVQLSINGMEVFIFPSLFVAFYQMQVSESTTPHNGVFSLSISSQNPLTHLPFQNFHPGNLQHSPQDGGFQTQAHQLDQKTSVSLSLPSYSQTQRQHSTLVPGVGGIAWSLILV